MKIYVAAVEALRKRRKDRMKLSLLPKLMVCFLSFIPRRMLMYFFCRFFFQYHSVYDQTQGSGAVFFLLLRITLLSTWVYIHLFVGR